MSQKEQGEDTFIYGSFSFIRYSLLCSPPLLLPKDYRADSDRHAYGGPRQPRLARHHPLCPDSFGVGPSYRPSRRHLSVVHLGRRIGCFRRERRVPTSLLGEQKRPSRIPIQVVGAHPYHDRNEHNGKGAYNHPGGQGRETLVLVAKGPYRLVLVASWRSYPMFGVDI